MTSNLHVIGPRTDHQIANNKPPFPAPHAPWYKTSSPREHFLPTSSLHYSMISDIMYAVTAVKYYS